MGKYLNRDSNGDTLGRTFLDKLGNLIADGAFMINKPTEWIENTVCVVDNGDFGAAAYIYDEIELKDFSYPDPRLKVWLKYEHAKQLAEETV